MSKKVPSGGALDEGLNIIIKETQRCKTIIQGLLEFARDREPHMVLTNINHIMEKALGILDNEFRLRHVTKEVRLTKSMVKTMLDENQIEQVFINLLLNALQAVEENGAVTVKSAVDPQKESVRVEITDNGCGIAVNDIKKIFEPFYSTKNKGTGLGLAVSYGIVKNHQGDIRVFSAPGEITRFTIELPIRAENSSNRGDHESAQHPGH
jgi:two-component system NtrC family sensor kinase